MKEDISVLKKRTTPKKIDMWDNKRPMDEKTYNVTNIQHKKGARVLFAAQIKLVEQVSDKDPNKKQLKLLFRSTTFDPQTIREYKDDSSANRAKRIVELLKKSKEV